MSVRDGQVVTSDGPYAESKELLAGFFLLDCESLDRAVEIAARLPEAELGLIEVRPVRDLDPTTAVRVARRSPGRSWAWASGAR